jgi:2-polyprenyl-6-hydroxyphenyl methylase/3-demethylubiquinone-9 3-methyltransferase
MADTTDLLKKESHFAFGKNWASYSELVTESQIAEAEAWLKRLLGDSIRGKRFLDIGCGSGLHSLAALRLGAAEVVGIDLDPDSVATMRKLLTKFAPDRQWKAQEVSVFDLGTSGLGQFDVVYSWGVLHHTGDMYRALRCAAAAVAPGGTFAFALYRLTRLCNFWKWEKRHYAHASPAAQKRAQGVFIGLFRVACLLTGRSFRQYLADYPSKRGMDFHHDVHDWMGGWPYESISPQQTEAFMTGEGFRCERQFVVGRTTLGLFGSGCDEYVYRRA